VTLAAGSGYTIGSPSSATVTIADNDAASAAQVVAVHIFYNNSAFDGNDRAANAQDDRAIAPDKQPLLPGGTASFANYTSYSKGINGLMVDIQGLPGAPLPADFVGTVGNSDTSASWAAAPAPSVSVRPGAGVGGAARVTLIWPDNAIQKTWLRVAVQANSRTGLTQPFVFYVGNAIGETGNSARDALVTVIDQLLIRNHPASPLRPAELSSRYDINRDRLVNATDVLLARSHATNPSTALRLIRVP
ncbi:MAG: hypothetical protein RMM29_09950, partial [Planctomycetota bacterium]|nr:hypothetical protein [Planctomycetota bacterium]